MKNLNKDIKIIRFIFISIPIIMLIVGLGFSYLIAEYEDAPGVIIIGTTITLVAASFVYGFGEMIIALKNNNVLLSDIHKELKNK